MASAERRAYAYQHLITKPAMTTTLEDLSLAEHPLRGLKRSVAAISVVLLLTSIAWCVWAWTAHRRLQARLADIASLHQPFWPGDFRNSEISKDENAAELWRAVFLSLPADDMAPSNSNLAYGQVPPYAPQWHSMENQSIIVNATVLDLAHHAACRRQSDWGLNAKLGGNSYSFNGQMRKTANILADAGMHAHFHVDENLALQRLDDALQLSRAQASNGTILDVALSTGISALCCERLMQMAPDMRVDSSDRAAILSMIQELLDTSEIDQRRVSSIDTQRMNDHDDLAGERQRRRVLSPLIELTEASVLETRGVDRLASAASSGVAARILYQSHPTRMMLRNECPASRDDFVGVYDYEFFTLENYLTGEYKGIAERRVAALALAIRLYRADQTKWPEHLADLVPQYVSAVPEDPLLGGPIGYVNRHNALPNGGDRPLLYFNLSTDPATSTPPDYPVYSSYSHSDQWRDLTLWTPPPPPPLPPGVPSGPGGFPMGPPGMPGMSPIR
jgi:hypothetical protein